MSQKTQFALHMKINKNICNYYASRNKLFVLKEKFDMILRDIGFKVYLSDIFSLAKRFAAAYLMPYFLY